MHALHPRLYEPDRAFIREGIGRYRNSKGVASALALADSLLHYVPDHGYSWQYKLQTRTDAMRAAGIRPVEVLQRVAEHYSLAERQAHLFKSQRAEQIALARHVLRAVKANAKPSTRLLIQFGAMLAEDLGAFAIHLLRRLHEDLAKRETLRRNTFALDEEERQ